MTLGIRGLNRELIVYLDMSTLTPEMGEIIRYRAVNRFDPDDEFDEWVKPSLPLSTEAERLLGVSNERLDRSRLTSVVMEALWAFTAP